MRAVDWLPSRLAVERVADRQALMVTNTNGMQLNRNGFRKCIHTPPSISQSNENTDSPTVCDRARAHTHIHTEKRRQTDGGKKVNEKVHTDTELVV